MSERQRGGEKERERERGMKRKIGGEGGRGTGRVMG